MTIVLLSQVFYFIEAVSFIDFSSNRVLYENNTHHSFFRRDSFGRSNCYRSQHLGLVRRSKKWLKGLCLFLYSRVHYFTERHNRISALLVLILVLEQVWSVLIGIKYHVAVHRRIQAIICYPTAVLPS